MNTKHPSGIEARPRARRSGKTWWGALAVLAALAITGSASAQQASLTLTNSDAQLCNHNNTAWDLAKTGTFDDLAHKITWTVTATRGATTANTIQVNGVVTVKNTGSAPATIGNIVIDLQKKSGAKWKAAAADVANATSGDAATSANILAAASESLANAGVYAISGQQGTFTETAASGTLEFTDANSNTTFAMVPQPVIPVGQSVTLLYTANFDNSILGIPSGTDLRVEAIVTFGNSGKRGGSGATGTNIDIDGDGVVDSSTALQTGENPLTNDGDEALIRSVPSRISRRLPELERCNDQVTLTDSASDVSVVGTGVAVSNFTTDIGLGSGTEVISTTAVRTVTVDVECTEGSAEVTNVAHLNGESDTVTVQGPQIGVDPITGQPIYQYFTFACCVGVALNAPSTVLVECGGGGFEGFNPGDYYTYTQGGYQGGGVPGQVLTNNFATVFSGGLTIGINDGAGPRHHAKWDSSPTGLAALKSFLGGGGPSGALTGDTLNATSVSGGALSKQTATLTLNVGFSGTVSSPVIMPAGFGALKLVATGTSLDGLTITQILAVANDALGGNGLPAGYTFGTLNDLITNLNESFDNGNTVTPWATAHLTQ